MNLLSNAARFTPQGEVTVRALARKRRGGIDLIVEDTGVGIPEDQLPKIFTAFHQVDGTQTREFGGAGLGLAIAKELAHLLGGDIHVQSQRGRGSAFTLTLFNPT